MNTQIANYVSSETERDDNLVVTESFSDRSPFRLMDNTENSLFRKIYAEGSVSFPAFVTITPAARGIKWFSLSKYA